MNARRSAELDVQYRSLSGEWDYSMGSSTLLLCMDTDTGRMALYSRDDRVPAFTYLSTVCGTEHVRGRENAAFVNRAVTLQEVTEVTRLILAAIAQVESV